MKIDQLRLLVYSMPLRSPLNMMGHLQTERHAAWIEIVTDAGNIAYGDVVPFPGIHKKLLAEILSLFKQNRENYKAVLEQHVQQPFAIKKICAQSSALNYGFETALMDLNILGALAPNSQWNLKGKRSRFLAVNGLIAGDEEKMLEQARGYNKWPEKVVKLKVGHRSVIDDVDLINKVMQLFAGQKKIRLDANRAWSLEQAKLFFSKVKLSEIEYIEEPCKTWQESVILSQQHNVPIACDESVLTEKWDAELFKNSAAIIVKPAVLGSIKKVAELANWAKQHHKPLIFSSLFESGVGLRHLFWLAAHYGASDLAHGFDTIRWLKDDLTRPQVQIKNGVVDCSVKAYSVDLSRVVEVV